MKKFYNYHHIELALLLLNFDAACSNRFDNYLARVNICLACLFEIIKEFKLFKKEHLIKIYFNCLLEIGAFGMQIRM
jgi:hypothetical protein